jgi:hypothetical protein
MKFSDDQLEKRIVQRGLPLLNKWIAVCLSSYSAPSNVSTEWFPTVRDSRRAQEVIFLSLYLPVWKSDRIIEHIAQLAFRYYYSGEWRIVQELLENYNTPARFVEIYLLHRSTDEFFGNFLPSCDRYLRYFSGLRGVQQVGPYKRKVRRRGYNDKGTLRPKHQQGRNLPGLPSEKEDRRKYILHPLSKFSEGVEMAEYLILLERR